MEAKRNDIGFLEENIVKYGFISKEPTHITKAGLFSKQFGTTQCSNVPNFSYSSKKKFSKELFLSEREIKHNHLAYSSTSLRKAQRPKTAYTKSYKHVCEETEFPPKENLLPFKFLVIKNDELTRCMNREIKELPRTLPDDYNN